MASQYGLIAAGLNYILRALTGGRIILDSPLNTVLIKTHNASAPGNVVIESIEAVVTADATATVVKAIAVPLSGVVHGVVRIVGKRTGAADSIASETIFGFVNNGGTTAALATAINRVVENSAGTPALTVVANDTNDTLDITVAGIAAQSWTWSGYVEYQTLTYA